MIYVGVIFTGDDAGVEGKIVAADTIEETQEGVQRYVDNHSAEDVEYAWSGGDYYPVEENTRYCNIVWARVYSAIPGEVFSFAEFR